MAGFPKDDTITLPERHLGLVQAQELSDIDAQLDKAASHIANTGLTALPAQVEFFPQEADDAFAQEKTIEGALAGTRIIIVRDSAFSFHLCRQYCLFNANRCGINLLLGTG